MLNPYQKIAILSVGTDLKSQFELRLLEGYYIQHLAVLPDGRILVIYTLPVFESDK